MPNVTEPEPKVLNLMAALKASIEEEKARRAAAGNACVDCGALTDPYEVRCPACIARDKSAATDAILAAADRAEALDLLADLATTDEGTDLTRASAMKALERALAECSADAMGDALREARLVLRLVCQHCGAETESPSDFCSRSCYAAGGSE